MKRRRSATERGGRPSKSSQLRRARSESEEESDGGIGSEDGSPRHAVVAARADSDQEEKLGDEEDEEDDEDEDDELLDFTQTEYAMSQMSQSAEPAPGSQDAEASNPKTPAVPSKVAQLSDKAVDDLTALLVRYLLYKGSLKVPIKFGDISKDVYPTYKNVSRFFFHRAKKQLEHVFGYQVVPVDDGTAKEVYLVINGTSSQEHWQLVNKTGKSSTRGLLMMILGLLWCAPARRLSEETLWKQLGMVDSRVRVNREHPQLGDVTQLVKTFEAQLYLHSTSEIDNDHKKVKYYSYGARTLKEVGKPQILNFVCKLITGRPPSDTQLDEVLMEDK